MPMLIVILVYFLLVKNCFYNNVPSFILVENKQGVFASGFPKAGYKLAVKGSKEEMLLVLWGHHEAKN